MPVARATRSHSAVAAAAVALAIAVAGPAGSQAPPPLPCKSRAVGKPWHGRLVCGVQLPADSSTFVTWDFPLGRSPNDGWRRWGTQELVTTVDAIAADYQTRFGPGTRLVVGDLSRPRGGSFGERFGGVGHASHQNGRDVDIFYPRRDGLERPADRPGQVDRLRAQWLVDRAARDAQYVFVGRREGLRRRFKRVQYLPLYHEDHLHLRIPQPPPPPPTPPEPAPELVPVP
jgi:murein endopeptidase